MRAAAIDIGTNTLLLTIGERQTDGAIRILRDEHSIARLGAGVDASGCINRAAIERAKDILQAYTAICRETGVERIAAVGTSALRDAANRAEVCAELETIIGHDIRIIDGETEASLSFRGTVEGHTSALVLDIGGGSTELIAGSNGVIEYRTSINIGALRLTERFFKTLPPHSDTLAPVCELLSQATPLNIPNYPLIAVAGTPTTLAAIALALEVFSAEKVHGFRLTAEKIAELTGHLLTLSVEDISSLPGVNPLRADILPAGALILQMVMQTLGYSYCTVSTKGLRYGVLEECLSSKK